MEIENDAAAEQRARGARRGAERRDGRRHLRVHRHRRDRHRRDQGRADLQAGGGHAGRRRSRSITTATDPRFIDTKNRPSLAQTFQRTATGGAATVVVNHLKSKGSDCNAVGDPDTGDGSGNCNITRTNAAKALVDWLATDPTGSGDPDYLLIGDFNSYTFEDPIEWFTTHGFTNLIRAFGGLDAYSYVFDGESGYLDHGLASPSLAAQVTGATDWHINPDEPTVLDYNVEFKTANQVNTFYDPGPYRASDHDPVVDRARPDRAVQRRPRDDHRLRPDQRHRQARRDRRQPRRRHDRRRRRRRPDLRRRRQRHDQRRQRQGRDLRRDRLVVGNPNQPGGNDTINGGSDDDQIFGEGGNDVIDGGSGDDFATGNAGNDSVSGGSDDDTLFGGMGTDTVEGGSGDDALFGTFGDDTLNGGSGNDFLDGDLPPDQDVGAGPGVDPNPNTDTCNGGSGHDQSFGCEISSSIEVVIPHF